MENIQKISELFIDYAFVFDVVILISLYVVLRHVIGGRNKAAVGIATLQRQIDYNLTELQAMQKERFAEATKTIGLSLRQILSDAFNDAAQRDKADIIRAAQNVNEELTGRLGECSTAMGAATGEVKALLEKQALYMHDRFAELRPTEDGADQHERLRADLSSRLAEQGREDRALLRDSLADSANLLRDSMDRLAGEVSAKLELLNDKIKDNFSEGMAETVASFQSLRERLNDLIAANAEVGSVGRDVASLSRAILTREAGQTAPIRLVEMLESSLPSDAYSLGAEVGGKTVAATLLPPGEEGAIAIDDSLAVDNPRDILSGDDGARAAFGESLAAHVNAVADSFIAPPQTAAMAILFVSSEALFAEIQAHHREALELAKARRVWLASPATLFAILNMARGAIKDHQARQQLRETQSALEGIVAEARNFESRLLEIGDHVGQAMRSVQRAETAGAKFFGQVRSAAGDGRASRLDDN